MLYSHKRNIFTALIRLKTGLILTLLVRKTSFKTINKLKAGVILTFIVRNNLSTTISLINNPQQ